MDHLSLRFRVEVAGGHTHVAVFAGPDQDHRALLGNLVFLNEEWKLLEPRIGKLTTDGVIDTTVSWQIT